MRLYGVVTSGVCAEVPVHFSPSKSLLDELAELPTGTKVGVQVLAPQDAEDFGGIRLPANFEGPDMPGHRYWRDIFTQNHLSYFSLEEPMIWAGMVDDLELYAQFIGKEEPEIKHEMNRIAARLQYKMTAERTAFIEQQIDELSLEVAIVQIGFGHYLYGKTPERFSFYIEQPPGLESRIGQLKHITSGRQITVQEAFTILNENMARNTLCRTPFLDYDTLINFEDAHAYGASLTRN